MTDLNPKGNFVLFRTVVQGCWPLVLVQITIVIDSLYKIFHYLPNTPGPRSALL